MVISGLLLLLGTSSPISPGLLPLLHLTLCCIPHLFYSCFTTSPQSLLFPSLPYLPVNAWGPILAYKASKCRAQNKWVSWELHFPDDNFAGSEIYPAIQRWQSWWRQDNVCRFERKSWGRGATVPPAADSLLCFPHTKTQKLHPHSVCSLEYFSHTGPRLLLQNNFTHISTPTWNPPTLSQSEGSSGLEFCLQQCPEDVEKNKCKKQGNSRAIHSDIPSHSAAFFSSKDKLWHWQGGPDF